MTSDPPPAVNVKTTEFKISQYADDTTLFLDGSRESFLESLKALERFGQLSGLRVNYEKTKAMWIGTSRYNDKNIEWPEDKVRALGVWFTLNSERSQLLNYQERSEKITKIINDWSHRRLTLIGKITVIKSLLASQLVYILSPLPTNCEYVKLIQKELYTFLWNGKNDKIKRTEIINNYSDGGLRMLDLKTFSRSLKFTWIQKYLNNKNNEKWKIFFDYHLSRYGGPFIFSCNISKEDIKYLEIPNQFLNEILELRAEVHFIEKDCLDQNAKKKQSIWNNSYIRIGNKSVY